MAPDEPSPNRISLILAEAAKGSGIVEMYVEEKKTVVVRIKLPELDILTVRVNVDNKNYPHMVQKLMRNARSMLAAKIRDKASINEIGYQIGTTLSEEQNYALFRRLAEEELERKDKSGVSDDQVLDLACDQENTELFFKNQYGEPYAAVRVGNDKHLEIIPLQSNKYEGYLTKLFYEKHGKLVGKDSLTRTLHLLSANTTFGDKTLSLHVRVAWGQSVNRARPDCIYIEMTDTNGRVIEVSCDGWTMITGSDPKVPILFRRYNQTAQIEPNRVYEPDILEQFLNLTNVRNENHRLLLKVYIISLLIPDIDHVVLATYGPKGTAKTLLLWLIKSLIDPTKPVLLTLQRDIPEFIQQVNHNYLAFYDNVKFIPYWLSDEICKAVTGIGHTKRKLYSDDEDIVYEHKRCIAINGIDVALTEPDAMDRSLFIKLEDIHDYNLRTKEELFQEFERIRSNVLGFILDTLVKAMKIKSTLRLSRLSRMAEFIKWGEAISRALGYPDKRFIEAYLENKNEQNIVAVEENVVGILLVKFYKEYEEEHKDCPEFIGSPQELYRELVNYADQNDISINNRQYPKAAPILVKKLNAVRSNLKEAYGIIVNVSRDKDNNSVITVSRRKTGLDIERLSKINVINNYYGQLVQKQHIQNYENLTAVSPYIPKITSGTSKHQADNKSEEEYNENVNDKFGGTEVQEATSVMYESKKITEDSEIPDSSASNTSNSADSEDTNIG